MRHMIHEIVKRLFFKLSPPELPSQALMTVGLVPGKAERKVDVLIEKSIEEEQEKEMRYKQRKALKK